MDISFSMPHRIKIPEMQTIHCIWLRELRRHEINQALARYEENRIKVLNTKCFSPNSDRQIRDK